METNFQFILNKKGKEGLPIPGYSRKERDHPCTYLEQETYEGLNVRPEQNLLLPGAETLRTQTFLPQACLLVPGSVLET